MACQGGLTSALRQPPRPACGRRWLAPCRRSRRARGARGTRRGGLAADAPPRGTRSGVDAGSAAVHVPEVVFDKARRRRGGGTALRRRVLRHHSRDASSLAVFALQPDGVTPRLCEFGAVLVDGVEPRPRQRTSRQPEIAPDILRMTTAFLRLWPALRPAAVALQGFLEVGGVVGGPPLLQPPSTVGLRSGVWLASAFRF